MAEKGFTQYLSDFMKVLKENGEDIIATTKLVEQLFTDTLELLTRTGRLDGAVEQIQNALDELIENLDVGDFFSIESLNGLFDDILKQIKDSLDIDLNQIIDPEDMLQAITDLIPAGVFPEEIEAFWVKIKEFLNEFDLSDVKVSIKTINNPVEKPGSGSTASTSNAIGSANSTSNFNVFAPQNASGNPVIPPTNSAGLDDLFENLTRDILNKFISEESLITDMIDKLESAIEESGFLNELDEKFEAFIKTIIKGDLSISALFDAISQLILDLLESALRAIHALLETFVTDIKNTIQKVKEFVDPASGTKPGPGSVVESILSQFGIQYDNPGIFALPAFLISIPTTFLTKHTGIAPSFTSPLQDAQDDSDYNNIFYGSVQLFKILGPLFGLAVEKGLKEGSLASIFFGLLVDIYGPTADVLGQEHSEPLYPTVIHNDPKDQKKKYFGYRIWEFQWVYNVGINYGFAFINLIISLTEHQAKATSPLVTIPNSLKNKLPGIAKGRDVAFPVLQLLFELGHFVLFFVLYMYEHDTIQARKDRKSLADEVPINDPRARNGYMLDAIPGIFDSLISFAKMRKDQEIESDKATLLRNINHEITSLRTNIPIQLNLIDAQDAPLTKFMGPQVIPPNPPNYRELDQYATHILGANGIIPTFQQIRIFLDRLDAADPDHVSRRLTQNVRENIARAPQVNWQELINKYKLDKPSILAFRARTIQLLGDVRQSLTDLKNGVESDNNHRIQTQIQILSAWIVRLNNIKRSRSQLRTDVLNNMLLARIFVDRGRHLSLITASNQVQASLVNLQLRLSLMIDQTLSNELSTLQTRLSTITTALEGRKNHQIRILLSLIPRRNRHIANNLHLFPPIEKPLKSLEFVLGKLNAIQRYTGNLDENMPESSLRRLKKEKDYLTYADIAFNGVFQLIYGALYVSVGDIPGTTSVYHQDEVFPENVSGVAGQAISINPTGDNKDEFWFIFAPPSSPLDPENPTIPPPPNEINFVAGLDKTKTDGTQSTIPAPQNPGSYHLYIRRISDPRITSEHSKAILTVT